MATAALQLYMQENPAAFVYRIINQLSFHASSPHFISESRTSEPLS